MVDPRETGASNPGGTVNTTPCRRRRSISSCRCGERITAHSWMYGGTAVCTECQSTIYLALKYSVKRKVHVIFPNTLIRHFRMKQLTVVAAAC
jgi:hypothetical protein